MYIVTSARSYKRNKLFVVYVANTNFESWIYSNKTNLGWRDQVLKTMFR